MKNAFLPKVLKPDDRGLRLRPALLLHLSSEAGPQKKRRALRGEITVDRAAPTPFLPQVLKPDDLV